MSFWSNIIPFIKKAVAKASAAFVAIFGKDASQQFADGAIALLKTAAGVIVMDVVQLIEASSPNASPDQKRSLAFEKIVADLKAAGITIGASVVNMLIEIAVQAIIKQNIVPVQ